MTSTLHDLRHAWRLARRQPGFAITALLTLALGVGANTAIFSVVQAVLLRPLPFRDPDRLVLVWETRPRENVLRNVANPGNYLAWKERNRVFEDMAAFSPWQANLAGNGGAERVPIGAVTSSFFSVLGVRPQLGRDFQASADDRGAEDAVLLSAGLWRQRHGGDPDVVGRRVLVDGRPAVVIGIMPDGFDVPHGARLWTLMRIGEDARASRGRWLATVARLKPGTTVERARVDLAAIAAATERERFEFNAGWSATAVPLHADLVRDVKPALFVLMAAVALVLLVACANVANLLLAAAIRRERELAIRAALGAGFGRLVRQLFLECALLALAGGVAGVLLARWMLDGLASILPAEIPAFMALRLDARVLLFTLAMTTLAALLCGLLPALRLRRPAVADGLRDGVASGARPQRRRMARALIVAEMALAGVLLVGAALLIRSFERLLGTDPGFRAADVLTFQVSLDEATRPDQASQARFHADAAASLAALPGVESAAAMSWQLMGMGAATDVMPADRPAPPPGEEPVAEVRVVTPRLFETLGLRLLEGRDFTPQDSAERPRVVVVNERLARDFWPVVSPLGRRIRMSWGDDIEAEIVGVVSDVRLTALGDPPRATTYWHAAQLPNSFMSYFVRSKLGPEALVPAVRQEMARHDSSVPLAEMKPLEEVVWASVERPFFVFALASVFAATAAALAGVGLFGVIAESVSQRRRELALRRALGAAAQDIVRLVLGEGLLLAGLGLLLGLALARAGAILLASQLYRTPPGSPDAYTAAAVFTLLVALGALLVPVLRALAAQPARELRAE
ncbi:MAG TPA: ABC transporter permease [Vicinamibacteria bacterium]|nr:ABC transporter permease [Vicinamibacteria bacterium]